jgi:hypothetical protein
MRSLGILLHPRGPSYPIWVGEIRPVSHPGSLLLRWRWDTQRSWLDPSWGGAGIAALFDSG